MALDFPNTPTLNQIFTAPNGSMWMWDGVKWGAITSVSPNAANNNVGRNLIHNSMFSVNQRGGGPFTIPVNNLYTSDRWVGACIAAGDSNTINVVTPSDGNRAQFGDESASTMLLNTFTGGSAAGNAILVSQYIEDVRRLANKTVTVSFWAAASAALKLGVSFNQMFGGGGSPPVLPNGQSVTLNSSAFVRYTLTFVLPSIAGKTVGANGDTATYLNFWLSAGSGFAARSGNTPVQSGTIWLWGIQLEIGSVATPLEKLDPRMDLANCQRFYHTRQGRIYLYGGAGSSWELDFPFPVKMRASPTIATSGVTYSNANSLTNTAGTADYTSFQALLTSTAGSGAAYFTFAASADL
jgi:hypothetical protein